MNISVLCTNPKAETVTRVIEEIQNQGHEAVILNNSEHYCFIPDTADKGRLYSKTNESESRVFKKNIERLIPRFGGSSHAMDMFFFLTRPMSIWSPFGYDAKSIAGNKWLTHCLLSQRGIQTVASLLVNQVNHENFQYSLNIVGGLPAFSKFPSGSQGFGVFVLETQEGAATAMQYLTTLNRMILQKKINAKKDSKGSVSDYRLIVIDGKVVCAMKRKSKADQLRANYSISGIGEPYEPTKSQKELAISAAAAVGLIGFAGVDLIIDEDGKEYILEVNSNPGVKIEQVCDYNYTKDLVEFAVRGKLSKEAKEANDKYGLSSAVTPANIPMNQPDEIRVKAANYFGLSLNDLSDVDIQAYKMRHGS